LEENSSFYAPEQHSLIPLNLAYSFAILWKWTTCLPQLFHIQC
jgi:hypothetical protein